MDNRWNLRDVLETKIKEAGGWVNTHSHLDRAYTIDLETLELGDKHLHEKWSLVDELKEKSSVNDYYDRMAYALEKQIQQGVSVVGSFIDVDEVAEDKVIKAASKLKEKYKDAVELVFINQALKGVLDAKARKWFDLGAEFVDVIGGLPGKDAGREDEHIDVLLETGKRLGKMIHVHVDQLNMSEEKETELLVKKTVEHGMQEKVVAIHCISVAAQKKEYRRRLYEQMTKTQVGVVCCPTAWIDARRSEELAPIHNAIAPVEEMIPEGIVVGLGTDNIADVYKPFTDGNMWTELRFLLEACHYYDVDELVKIATVNGRKVLGLEG